jgi:hypothetical protein
VESIARLAGDIAPVVRRATTTAATGQLDDQLYLNAAPAVSN